MAASTGAHATSSVTFQRQPSGSAPTSTSPPSTPSMPANSRVLRRKEAFGPGRSWSTAVRLPTMTSVCASPVSIRPATSTGNGPALASSSMPVSSVKGAASRAAARWRLARAPTGRSAAMRAKPNEPASTPSSQSGRPWTWAMSGSSGPKAPMQIVLAKTTRHSRAVPRSSPMAESA